MHKLKCLLLILCMTSMQVVFADSISGAVDTNMAAQRAECDKNTAMVWSSKLSRCIGKQSAVDTRNAVMACDAMTDLEAKKKCNIAIAEKSTGLSSDTGSLNQGKTTSSMVMNGATTAYAVSSLISVNGTSGKNSKCTSKTIFAVTSIGGLASDVYLKMKAKKKVKELEGKYAIDTKSTAAEAQVKALQYLKEEQQTVADIAGLEKKRNMVLMLGYGLAAGWAIYEMTPMGANADCVPDKKGDAKPEAKQNDSIDVKGVKAPDVRAGDNFVDPNRANIHSLLNKLFSITENFLISGANAGLTPPPTSASTILSTGSGTSSATAAAGTSSLGGTVGAAGSVVPAAAGGSTVANGAAANSLMPQSFKEFLQSSMGIAIISGIATVYSGILYKAADEQQKESTANVAKVDKMIKSFTDSGATTCMSGREDISNAKCYCYAADGTKNSNRSNSQTCIDLWAKNDYKITGDAANYNVLAFNADVAGCMTVDNQFDETCKCKKLVNASGVNACLKESSISLSNSALATGFGTSAVKTLADYTANATSGNPRFDLLSSATLGAQAIKAAHLAQDIATKIPSKDVHYPLINESNVGKYAKAVIGERAIAAAASKSSAMGMAAAGPSNPALGTLLHQAQAKVGIDITGSGKGLAAVKEKKKNGIDLNFGNEGGGNSGGQVLGNFPEEKNYKFKNSDIVTDNKASIFEIISNRYVQSGLKRLFDDEK